MAELTGQLQFPLGDDVSDEDTVIIKLIKAWVGTLQPIEDTAQAMITQKDINLAEGAQLDALGKIVGQARAGLSDADYRRYLSARIATNRSDGIVDDLIKVASLVLNDVALTVVVSQAGTATVQVFIGGIPVTFSTATILSLFLQEAKSGGVRLELVFNSSPVANWGYFDNFNGTIADSTFTMFDTLP